MNTWHSAARRPLVTIAMSLGIISQGPIVLADTMTSSSSNPIESNIDGERDEEVSANFTTDLITDVSIIGASATFGVVLELILRTGELRPQDPLDPSILIGIDRPFALSDEKGTSASKLSTAGAGLAILLALTDVGVTAFTDRHESALTYAVLYAESATLDWAINDLVKIAVRRPRPKAYREVRLTGQASMVTDDALSFYSGHTSVVAALGATATYLAFMRDPEGAQGWWTLGGSMLLTAFVGFERIKAREHFPTDVFAGAVAGAAVGVLVPHLHRNHESRFAIVPSTLPGGGGLVSVLLSL